MVKDFVNFVFKKVIVKVNVIVFFPIFALKKCPVLAFLHLWFL